MFPYIATLCERNDTSTISTLEAEAATLEVGNTGKVLKGGNILEGNTPPNGKDLNDFIFINAEIVDRVTKQLYPTTRGSVENLASHWVMTYNGNNTVITPPAGTSKGAYIELVFGFGDPQEADTPG